MLAWFPFMESNNVDIAIIIMYGVCFVTMDELIITNFFGRTFWNLFWLRTKLQVSGLKRLFQTQRKDAWMCSRCLLYLDRLFPYIGIRRRYTWTVRGYSGVFPAVRGLILLFGFFFCFVYRVSLLNLLFHGITRLVSGFITQLTL